MRGGGGEGGRGQGFCEGGIGFVFVFDVDSA